MKISIYTIFIITICSCNEHNVKLSNSLNILPNKIFYILKITNNSSKDKFLLVPSSYIRKVGCSKIYSIRNVIGANEIYNFFCDSFAKTESPNLFNTMPFLVVNYQKINQDNLSKKLISYTSEYWKKDFEMYLNTIFVQDYPTIIFVKKNSSCVFEYEYQNILPKGEYSIFSEVEKGMKKMERYQQLVAELKRINQVDTYYFEDITEKTSGTVTLSIK